jgi:hypothetical protein
VLLRFLRASAAGMVLSATVMAAASGGAQDSQARWVRQVRELLKSSGEALERYGYILTEEMYTGALSKGESESLSVDLVPRPDGYVITGVCDEDCDDLDLELTTLYGDSVAKDDETDDTPLVRVPGGRKASKYRLKVTMASCSNSPCYYGVGVYGRR